MSRPKEEPIKRTEEPFGGDTEETETHPAFGLITFSRIQGKPGKLFGTPLSDHGSFIQMTVYRAQRHHHLSYDRYHAFRQPVVQLELSAVQFSTLLTTMNMGDGTPCTLRYIDGQAIPYIPEELETEQEKVAVNFKKEMTTLSKELQEATTQVKEILSKKSLLKSDREAIQSAFDKVTSFWSSHAPFVMDQFAESTEKVSNAAKAEVDAFMTNALVATGLETLKKRLQSVVDDNAALPSGEEGEDK
jgi:hypothetical protein